MELIDIFGDIDDEEFDVPTQNSLEDIADQIKADFLDYLENRHPEKERKPGLHCSSLWKTCARARVLAAKHADELPPPETPNAVERMTYDEGHALHDLMQTGYGQWGRIQGDWKCLRCQKIVFTGAQPKTCPLCGLDYRDRIDGSANIVYIETGVENDLGYVGHRDGLLVSRCGKIRGFEFKSISKSQFRDLKEPKWAHVIQAHAYMATEDYDEYVIWYWDKASQGDWEKHDGRWVSKNPHLKIYIVPFNDKLWQRMEKRIRDYHAAGELIEKTDRDKLTGTEFPRVCPARSCELAGECSVRDFCFERPKA